MDYRGQGPSAAASHSGPGLGTGKKTVTMTGEFYRLFGLARPAFAQERTFGRAKTLALSALVGLGRRTVSGMLCTSAQQFGDWSAAYRLFEQDRFDHEALLAQVYH